MEINGSGSSSGWMGRLRSAIHSLTSALRAQPSLAGLCLVALALLAWAAPIVFAATSDPTTTVRLPAAPEARVLAARPATPPVHRTTLPRVHPALHPANVRPMDDGRLASARPGPAPMLSAAPLPRTRDELRLLRERLSPSSTFQPVPPTLPNTAQPVLPTPLTTPVQLPSLNQDPGSSPVPVSPAEALTELQSLQAGLAQAAGLSPAQQLAPGDTPSGTSSQLQAAPAGPPAAMPPLEVGPPLSGMPEYIVVGRTFAIGCTTPARDIPTERLRFVDYVRNVLPNEWVSSWPDASLDAGAIAVKEFAWYTAVIERKWRSRGYPFDVVDSTCDQVYRDARAGPRTDAAFQRTWGIALTRNGVPVHMSYRDTDATCGWRSGCMGQVESAVLAGQGYSALQILARYYGAPGTVVSSTGSALPALLPPVPPALALPARPAPTATATAPARLDLPAASPVPSATATSGKPAPTELPPPPSSTPPGSPTAPPSATTAPSRPTEIPPSATATAKASTPPDQTPTPTDLPPVQTTPVSPAAPAGAPTTAPPAAAVQAQASAPSTTTLTPAP